MEFVDRAYPSASAVGTATRGRPRERFRGVPFRLVWITVFALLFLSFSTGVKADAAVHVDPNGPAGQQYAASVEELDRAVDPHAAAAGRGESLCALHRGQSTRYVLRAGVGDVMAARTGPWLAAPRNRNGSPDRGRSTAQDGDSSHSSRRTTVVDGGQGVSDNPIVALATTTHHQNFLLCRTSQASL